LVVADASCHWRTPRASNPTFRLETAPVLQYDFEESVGYWTVMAAHAMHRALSEELAPEGITHRQWQVLAWLAIDGILSQGELAERMEIEPATLVSVLARMERNGWIARRSCAGDRRKRLVEATPAAQPIWERGVECARRVREHATRGFSDRDRQELKRLLEALRTNLQADYATTPDEALSDAI
jgi:MarR family transcriptional regulator for hemolysin